MTRYLKKNNQRLGILRFILFFKRSIALLDVLMYFMNQVLSSLEILFFSFADKNIQNYLK